MKLLKQIVKVIWPIVNERLEKLAESTDTRFDDIALIAVNQAIISWLEFEDDEDDED